MRRATPLKMQEFIQTWWSVIYGALAGFAPDLVSAAQVNLVTGALIFVASLVVAWLFSRVVFRRLLRISITAGINFDVKTVAAVRLPLTVLIVLAGAYAAIIVNSPPPEVQSTVNKVAGICAVVTGAALINGVAAAALQWLQLYLDNSSVEDKADWLLPLARRVVLAALIAMTFMVSLDVLGINITPLIAGLGITGLAVALALQPTLSNLFAGTYVVSEGVVSIGDYVEMENGITGYVVDVNWRSTRLRTWTNNLVIIPNSRFAETIITNYNKPEDPVNVFLQCGVAYESDLQRVEEVSHEVMDRVLREHPGAAPEYGAYFGYETFGESNVDFWLFVQSKDRLASFEVRSELIKQLHARLTEEGITINYPVRTLHFPDGWNPQDGTPLPPQAARVRRPAISHTRTPLPDDAPGGGGDGPDV